jgi:hypothetical protein
MPGNSTKTRFETSRVQERLVLSLYFLQTQIQKFQLRDESTDAMK